MGDTVEARIHLLDYTVNKLVFESDFSTPAVPSHLDFSFGYQVRKKPGEDEYLLVLRTGVNDEQKAFRSAGFRVSIEIGGIFRFGPGMSKQEKDQLLLLNGLATLYSTARGVVAQVSGQSHKGKFVLPMVNVLELVRQCQERERSKKRKKKVRERPSSAEKTSTSH